MTSILDEIRTVRTKKAGCQVNGCPNGAEVVVELRVRESTRQRATVASDSLSACPNHAVTIYKTLKELVEKARVEGDSKARKR